MPTPMRLRPRFPLRVKPVTMPTTPTTISPKPTRTRRRNEASGIATSSRSAATGGIAEARRAGRYAATIVTTTPTTYDATTVRRLTGKDARLRSKPIAPKSSCRPRARR